MRLTMSPAAILAAAILSFGVVAHASAAPMSANDLKTTVIGKRIFLKIPLGGEFPLYYKPDGQVEGKSPNGLLARLDPKTDTGRWWVKGDSLCQKWSIWYDQKSYCFTLESSGPSTLNWVREDGLSGTARVSN